MSLALSLLVLLAPGDEALAGSLVTAARSTLGEGAAVELRVITLPDEEAAARALMAETHAQALAVIEWREPEKEHAQIRLFTLDDPQVFERELTFAASDAAEERGRTLGFTLASMLPEARPIASAPPETAPDASPTPVAQAAAPAPAPGPAPATPPDARAPWRAAFDVAGVAAVAIAGEGMGFGGELAGQVRLNEQLALRASVALRLGELEALDARTTSVDLGPGIVWRSHDTEPGRPFALALRLDALARLLRVRLDAQHDSESHGHVVPVIGLSVEASYALSRELGLTASAGARAILGETEVISKGQPVASFAPVELGFALGTRLRL
jgi:hypothetical protein